MGAVHGKRLEALFSSCARRLGKSLRFTCGCGSKLYWGLRRLWSHPLSLLAFRVQGFPFDPLKGEKLFAGDLTASFQFQEVWQVKSELLPKACPAAVAVAAGILMGGEVHVSNSVRFSADQLGVVLNRFCFLGRVPLLKQTKEEG